MPSDQDVSECIRSTARTSTPWAAANASPPVVKPSRSWGDRVEACPDRLGISSNPPRCCLAPFLSVSGESAYKIRILADDVPNTASTMKSQSTAWSKDEFRNRFRRRDTKGSTNGAGSYHIAHRAGNNVLLNDPMAEGQRLNDYRGFAGQAQAIFQTCIHCHSHLR